MSNVGNIDRIVRVVLGLVLVALPFILGWTLWATVVSVGVGVVLLGTATISFCPIYWALRLSTRKPSHS